MENKGEGLKETALTARHRQDGARLVPYAGYRMPLSYDSILNEHRVVRDRVGIFDLSHMGQIYVSGDGALAFLDQVLSNDPGRLEAGRAQYSLLLNPDGGIIDDLILYKLKDGYLLVVNASRRDQDRHWLRKNLTAGVELVDRGDDYGIIAVQGPAAGRVLQEIGVTGFEELYHMEHRTISLLGRPVLLAGSGYTGEDGCEIYAPNEHLPAVWDALLSVDPGLAVRPVGLGARDTLRTELCYCLYGQELDEETNPLEADLAWVCHGRDFIGKEKVDELKREGPARSLVAFRTSGPVPPRPGYEILIGDETVGRVTSGTWSPSLQTGIGMGFVPPIHRETGTDIVLSGRGRRINGTIENKPLYGGGSIRRRPKKLRRAP